ncbi:MAG: oxidoreductase, partial [Lachnospiraceae bacterium]|nr:oxidoreductase [Lachnospiraceae bacterium]
AAEDFRKRLGIPSLEMTRVYQVDKIRKQYELLGTALGVKIEDSDYYEEALQAVKDFGVSRPKTTFAVGEWMNGDPFELSLSLLRYGHSVSEIYGTVTDMNFIYIRKIAALSPDTKIYTNLSPTMLNYNCGTDAADITIGQDAAFYHPDSPNVPWNAERKLFGYAGLRDLFREISRV